MNPAPPPGPAPACTDEVCITCSDEAQLVEVERPLDDGWSEVRALGRLEKVDTSLVEPVAPGDLLLVHAGVAITKVAEERV